MNKDSISQEQPPEGEGAHPVQGEAAQQGKEATKKKEMPWLLETLLVVATVLVIVGLFQNFIGRQYVIPSGSMEPTLVPGERVLMDSAWYRLSSPKRGDIIAFRTSEDKKASIHIKRVIALPGETVQIKDGQILINGEVYNEKDEFPAITNAGLASEPITVGKGQYFVLGDNRNNSEDSRHNGMGLVNSDRIVGKLWFTISPWKKIGFV